MRIITKNIRKVKDNEAKVSFLDNFNCIPRGSLTMIYATAYTGKSSFMIALGKDTASSKKEISYYHFDFHSEAHNNPFSTMVQEYRHILLFQKLQDYPPF